MKRDDKSKRNNREGRSGAQTQLIVAGIEVTLQAMEDPYIKRLPTNLQRSLTTRIEEMNQLSQNKPAEAIEPLEKLIAQYPGIPQFYNYLYVAHTKLNEVEKAEAILLKSLERHPDYLFGKINYAQLCIFKKELAKIPKIFNDQLDLKLLYPNRKRFHVAEVIGFMGTVGYYLCENGQREKAQIYYEILDELAPEHDFTERLRKALNPSLLQRWTNKLKNVTKE